MKVVFDTNIWIKHLALQTVAGSSVRLYLNQMGAIVALPNVIRRETEQNLREQLLDHLNHLRSSHRTLLSALGQMKELVLPSESDIHTAAKNFTDRLGLPIEEIPFSMSVADSALTMVLQRTPPNGPKNQQFKDSVVWAHCMELLSDDDIALVTEDRGFFESRKPENGLATNLRRETAGAAHRFRIFGSLESFLEEIRAEISISPEVVVDAFRSEFGDIDLQMANTNGYEIGSPRFEADYFITEVPSEMYVTGSILWDCSADCTLEALLSVNVSGIYNAAAGYFTRIRREGEVLTRSDEHGKEEIVAQSAILHVQPLHIGHRTVTHEVRHRLQTEWKGKGQ